MSDGMSDNFDGTKINAGRESAQPSPERLSNEETLRRHGLTYTCRSCGELYAIGTKCDLCEGTAAQPSPRHAEESRERRNGWLYIRCLCGYEAGPFLYADYAQDAITHHIVGAAAQPEAGEPRIECAEGWIQCTEDHPCPKHAKFWQDYANPPIAAPAVEPLTAEQFWPRKKEPRDGWTIDTDFINAIAEDDRVQEESVSWEGVEAVLLASEAAFAHQVRQEAEPNHLTAAVNQKIDDMEAEITRLTAERDALKEEISTKTESAYDAGMAEGKRTYNIKHPEQRLRAERAEAALREARDKVCALPGRLYDEIDGTLLDFGGVGDYVKRNDVVAVLQSSTPAEGQ